MISVKPRKSAMRVMKVMKITMLQGDELGSEILVFLRFLPGLGFISFCSSSCIIRLLLLVTANTCRRLEWDWWAVLVHVPVR